MDGPIDARSRTIKNHGQKFTLRLIKRLVDELGINLAGVQRLLSIAEVMQRIRPLMDEGALSTGSGRRQLLLEMRRLNDALGL